MPKPRFRSTLSATPYADGRTWYLDRPLTYVRGTGEIITVPTHFESDWASVPRLFWSLLPPFGSYGWASIVHDWLYWTQRCTRLAADDTLLEAMIATNVAPWQRRLIYRAVRDFGWIAWKDNARIAGEGYSRIRGLRGPANRPAWKRRMLRAAFATS